MVNFIQFSPISGVHSDEPVCFILEIDHAKILLDCGWEPPFDPEVLKSLKKNAKDIDCVLLSHGTLRHCGGLVYAFTTLGLTCPIYTTFPVQTMGKFNVLEALINLKKQTVFSLFQASDIHRVFSKISLLKYSQPQTLSGTWMMNTG
ncbi:hypothetical protein HMI55_003170 [Coelomomyces lativittatus]|nr:hypothetical protein HMI56_003278 [Coelomomyces lativittatus]KAJ1501888.1 hypothetical protein HMI55_003170 [Coelomomyces lativittatus]